VMMPGTQRIVLTKEQAEELRQFRLTEPVSTVLKPVKVKVSDKFLRKR
jgi:hypothetical protein